MRVPQILCKFDTFFDFIKYRMEEYGRPIGVKYAEAFTVERTFGVDNLTNLI